MSTTNDNIQKDLEAVIQAAFTVSEDLGSTVEDLLKIGREKPLSAAEARELLTKVLNTLMQSAHARGDARAATQLQGDLGAIVERVVALRERVASDGAALANHRRLALLERNGIKPNPIFPRPTFHEREIAMNGGFVKTTDVELWNE